MSPTSSWPGTADLATDTWTFEAQWSARPGDDPARCADALQACLQGAAALHPSLSQWYDDAEPVALDTASLRDRLDREWDQEHPGGETGVTIALWNGAKEVLARSTITVTCGATASYLKNDVEMDLPRPAAAPELYRAETMLTLFQTMISAWQPQWCRVQPWSLREASGRGTVDVLASWILYLDHDLHTTKGPLPHEVSVVEGPGSGDLLVLAPTPAEMRFETIDRLREVTAFPDEWSLLR